MLKSEGVNRSVGRVNYCGVTALWMVGVNHWAGLKRVGQMILNGIKNSLRVKNPGGELLN